MTDARKLMSGGMRASSNKKRSSSKRQVVFHLESCLLLLGEVLFRVSWTSWVVFLTVEGEGVTRQFGWSGVALLPMPADGRRIIGGAIRRSVAQPTHP